MRPALHHTGRAADLEQGGLQFLESSSGRPPRAAGIALRHRRSRKCAGVCRARLGSGVALGAAHRRAACSGKGSCSRGPLDALFDLHLKAVEIFQALLDDTARNWNETMKLDAPWLPPDAPAVSRRKIAAHALFHSQRHWAQLATLVRAAGFPSEFKGDLLFSSALV